MRGSLLRWVPFVSHHTNGLRLEARWNTACLGLLSHTRNAYRSSPGDEDEEFRFKTTLFRFAFLNEDSHTTFSSPCAGAALTRTWCYKSRRVVVAVAVAVAVAHTPGPPFPQPRRQLTVITVTQLPGFASTRFGNHPEKSKPRARQTRPCRAGPLPSPWRHLCTPGSSRPPRRRRRMRH